MIFPHFSAARRGDRGLLTLVAFALLASGCAALPGNKADPGDPFERMNRGVFRFNDALDRSVAKPVAKTYRKITPKFAQTGVANFMANISYPKVIVNDLLQAKFVDTASDIGRLLLNSTLGLGGLLDPATDAGLPAHDEDFGQTLGKWGVKSGPYLMLPVLGPSTVRDSVALVPEEIYLDPRSYLNNSAVDWGLRALGLINRRAQLLDTDSLLEQAADKYVLVRSAYLQHREYEVTDGKMANPSPEDFEDPDPGADSRGAAPPPVTPVPSPAPAPKGSAPSPLTPSPK